MNDNTTVYAQTSEPQQGTVEDTSNIYCFYFKFMVPFK